MTEQSLFMWGVSGLVFYLNQENKKLLHGELLLPYDGEYVIHCTSVIHI